MAKFNKLDEQKNIIDTVVLENTVDTNNGIEFEINSLYELSKDNDFNWVMVNGSGIDSNSVNPKVEISPSKLA